MLRARMYGMYSRISFFCIARARARNETVMPAFVNKFTVTPIAAICISFQVSACAPPPQMTGTKKTDNPEMTPECDKSFLLKTCEPRKDREETVMALDSLLKGPRPCPSDVHGPGPILLSDIPAKAVGGKSPVVLGIDEAGRGPVLGPMVYGAAFWSKDDADSIPNDFNDSKQLSEEKRNYLFHKIKETPEIGFVARVLHASEISRSMLRREPYNLNAMSHDAAIQMIRAVLDAGVKVDTAFIDTVGIADSYRAKLEREFEGHSIRFVVEKKADAKYAPCSAASVVAKVSRDTLTSSWTFSEPEYEPVGGRLYGSGYPSDPKCKNWVDKNLADPIFGFPDLARFSWGPMKKTMQEKGVTMTWEADDDDEEDAQQMRLNAFMVKKGADGRPSQRKRPRLAYFDKMGLTAVTEWA